jgi:uncharacterized membrane protein
MWLTSAVFLAALVWVAAGVTRGRGDSTDGPRRILDERMARGDIDRDEYRERLAALGER